jgi:copper chaperone NosL
MAATTVTLREQRGLRIVLGLAAAVLVVLAWRLPVWQARLTAPQFPPPLGPLRLTAYGHGVEGDIEQVNQLNHYVGMQAFSNSNAPEMALWAPTVLLALILVGLATFLRPGRRLSTLAKVGLWLIPVGTLIDVQVRLWQYGQSVQPDAAIRLDPFVPLVIGPTKVLNFTTWAYPGEALWAIALAALLVTFGERIVRSSRDRWVHRPVYVSDEEYEALARAGRT